MRVPMREPRAGAQGGRDKDRRHSGDERGAEPSHLAQRAAFQQP